MFSSESHLRRRTGKYGTPRFEYLQQLIQEFQDTEDIESKRQIICNLANFAYDPINYGFFRELNIFELFLDCLTEDNDDIKEFAIGGLCNGICDLENMKVISENIEIKDIIRLLSSTNVNTVLHTITTLYYMLEEESLRPKLIKKNILHAMSNYKDCSNKALSNLATIYLEKCEQYKNK
ncbi:hypothetical protein WA158_008387 [Blastocystis sp. Blastoise]